MKVAILVLTLGMTVQAYSQPYSYISPKPGSASVSKSTNIIVRSSTDVDPLIVPANTIIVRGEASGAMEGTSMLAADGRTKLFTPSRDFVPGEIVYVTVMLGEASESDATPFTFSFTIMPHADVDLLRYVGGYDRFDGISSQKSASAAWAGTDAVSLPAPPITVDSVNNPSAGSIFLAAWDRNVPRKYGNFFFILDRFGAIQDSIRVEGAPFDFKVQPNGNLSYGIGDFSTPTPEGNTVRYYVLDSTLAVIDSFGMKNGYPTDFHEFLILPNGHALMMSYHTIIYDMSTVVPGGRVDASLVINVLQEQDRDKNVVFEWRNIDYIPITDSDLDLTASRINYSTLNAFDVDTDGHILASFRNHSEIMKISRETGEILWRWGSDRGSFSFIDEHPENAPTYFSRQHNVQRLDNGLVTLFDNGEFHSPPYSRAAAYEMDEQNMTARLVSEYRYAGGDIRAAAAGNAQFLPDGGWFVGYGILHPMSQVKRNIVEVHADGSIALEISLPANVSAYRVGKYPWREEVTRASVSQFEMLQGNTYTFNVAGDTTGVSLYFEGLSGESYNLATVTRIPYGPKRPQFIGSPPHVAPVSFLYEGASITAQITDITVDCSVYPEVRDPANTSIYFRSIPDNGLFQKLTTTYDSVSNALTARTTSFGEYIFATPDVQAITRSPILVLPEPGMRVHQAYPVGLLWTGEGRGLQFRLQIMKDSIAGSAVLDTTVIGSAQAFESPEPGRTYVWRVGAVISGAEPLWSVPRSFRAVGGFVEITEPDTGGIYGRGTLAPIRWTSNEPDSLLLQLFAGGQYHSDIATIPASNGGYTWSIPQAIQPDSTYRIRIAALNDPAVSDTSGAPFSIVTTTRVQDERSEIPVEWSLEQNFPNPFNPSTRIAFVLPVAQDVRLSVHSLLGQEIATIDEGFRRAGRHEVFFDGSGLPSGVYLYRLSSKGMTLSRKLVLLK